MDPEAPNHAFLGIDFGTTTSSMAWYNPRKGGRLAGGSVRSIQGPGKQGIGSPPAEMTEDWLAVVTAR